MTRKGKLALLKCWKNLWEHKLKRSSQTPCLSWASESTWSPRGKLVMTEFTEVVTALQAGWEQKTSTQLLSHHEEWAQGWHPSHKDLHLSVPCSKKAEPHRSWHGVPTKDNAFVLAMLEASLIWSHQGGDADHPWDRPPKQFRWSTAFSVVIVKEANAMRQASSLPVTRYKKKTPKATEEYQPVNRRKVDHICSAAMSPNVSGSTEKLDPAPLVKNKVILFGILGWVKEHLHRALQNLKAQTLILLPVAPILWAHKHTH